MPHLIMLAETVHIACLFWHAVCTALVSSRTLRSCTLQTCHELMVGCSQAPLSRHVPLGALCAPLNSPVTSCSRHLASKPSSQAWPDADRPGLRPHRLPDHRQAACHGVPQRARRADAGLQQGKPQLLEEPPGVLMLLGTLSPMTPQHPATVRLVSYIILQSCTRLGLQRCLECIRDDMHSSSTA